MSLRRQALILVGVFTLMAIPYFFVARAFAPPERDALLGELPVVRAVEPVPAPRPLSCGGAGIGLAWGPDVQAGLAEDPLQAVEAIIDEHQHDLAELPPLKGKWRAVHEDDESARFELEGAKGVNASVGVVRVKHGWAVVQLDVCEG